MAKAEKVNQEMNATPLGVISQDNLASVAMLSSKFESKVSTPGETLKIS